MQGFAAELSALDERMKTLLEQEQMILGMPGKAVGLPELRAWFNPYHDLWAGAQALAAKKAEWKATPVAEIHPGDVDEAVTQANRLLKRL